MDNIVRLYTSLDGRISRKTWWLGVLGLIVASIVLGLLLGLVGLSMWPSMGAPDVADPDALSAALAAGSRSAAWGGLISFVILAYPSYALSLKRRQDRDNNGLDLKIYYGLTVVMLLVQAVGIGYAPAEVPGLPGVMVPTPSLPLVIVGFAVGIAALYLLIVMGFLKGTPGPNTYGPDPLAA